MLARKHLVLAGAALLALSACAGKQKTETPQETARQAATTKPTDPEIVGILVAANEVDIEGGRQAEKMASAEQVQAFGKQMVTDHTSLNQQGADLAKKLGVEAKESDTSKQLRENGKKAAEKRESLKGADYDRAYLDDEIAFHVAVLQAIDETLLPSAQNAELKALITQARPHIAAHLEQASTLRGSPALSVPQPVRK